MWRGALGVPGRPEVCITPGGAPIVAAGSRWRPVQKTLVVLGSILVVVGLLWPWLGSLPFGRLPGDVAVERDNVRVYFPIVTMLLISAVVSLVLWLMRH